MIYKIVPTNNFSRELKKLCKKHPALKEQIKYLSTELSVNPERGVSLGHGCYKIRISSPDKHGGKSKGFRIITYVVLLKGIVFLLTVYDKSEISTIKDSEIRRILKDFEQE